MNAALMTVPIMAAAAAARNAPPARSDCEYNVHVSPGVYQCMTSTEYSQYRANINQLNAHEIPIVGGIFAAVLVAFLVAAYFSRNAGGSNISKYQSVWGRELEEKLG